MYDFALFEHTQLVNHCKDICIIAKLLTDCGYSVAIANVSIEGECCKDSGFPIITLSARSHKYLHRSLYYAAVIRELSGIAKNIYAGTLMTNKHCSWMCAIPIDTNVFFWGLRSYYLNEFKRWPYHKSFLRSIWIYLCTKFNNNIKLFVSDIIIKEEFISLGWNEKRLIIRPERMIENLSDIEIDSIPPKEWLIIGSLRPGKRIDLCIDAFNSINSNDYHLNIAGIAYRDNGYADRLNQMANGCPYATRIERRLSEEEYNGLLNTCDYLILCDEQQPSSITNGTMNEALLAGKPIIAPNYNPYKYVIETYGVGFLYEMGNIESLVSVLKKSKETSISSFSSNIREYQKTLKYENVIKSFTKEMKQAIEL